MFRMPRNRHSRNLKLRIRNFSKLQKFRYNTFRCFNKNHSVVFSTTLPEQRARIQAVVERLKPKKTFRVITLQFQISTPIKYTIKQNNIITLQVHTTTPIADLTFP